MTWVRENAAPIGLTLVMLAIIAGLAGDRWMRP